MGVAEGRSNELTGFLLSPLGFASAVAMLISENESSSSE